MKNFILLVGDRKDIQLVKRVPVILIVSVSEEIGTKMNSSPGKSH